MGLHYHLSFAASTSLGLHSLQLAYSPDYLLTVVLGAVDSIAVICWPFLVKCGVHFPNAVIVPLAVFFAWMSSLVVAEADLDCQLEVRLVAAEVAVVVGLQAALDAVGELEHSDSEWVSGDQTKMFLSMNG